MAGWHVREAGARAAHRQRGPFTGSEGRSSAVRAAHRQRGPLIEGGRVFF